jgi:CRP-like cAMP-binding protein
MPAGPGAGDEGGAPAAPEFLAFLRRVPLFRGLGEGELANLAPLFLMRRYGRGSTVIAAEEEGEFLFVIRSGRAKVSIVHRDGREVILSFLGPGEVFGELSVLDGRPRSADVVVTEDAELMMLRRTDFLDLLHRRPRIAVALLEELASRMRRTDHQFAGLALLDVTNRVARTLLYLAEERGVETADGLLLEERPTHQELACMAGTTRETVTRVIGQLEQQGYIACRGRSLLILREEPPGSP